MTFYTFANATTSIPLANLDANFATPITLGNTAVTINGTFSSIGNLTLNNVTVASGNSTVTKETVTTITSPAATNLTIQSAGTTAMTIDTSQNVGIGTSSPTSKLEVAGQINGSPLYIKSGGSTSTLYYDSALLFTQSGTGERMRIDSSGNVGIGTTSPAVKLQIGSATSPGASTNTANYINVWGDYVSANGVTGGVKFFNADANNASATPYQIVEIDSARDSNNYGGAIYLKTSDTSGVLTERARIDSSGTVSIGTTQGGTGFGLLNVQRNASSSQSSLSIGDFNTVSNDVGIYLRTSTNAGISWTSGGYLAFYRGGPGVTESMRIDSSGNLLVGQTSKSQTTVGFYAAASGEVSGCLAASTNAATQWNTYSTGAGAYRFYVGMGGTIFATSIVITAISDQRLKENIRDIDTGLSAIMALKPRRFDWKEGKGQDKKNAAGFIAQEFETIFPECVSTSLAGADGIEYKNINHETLIPTLVKAIQELKAELDAYKATHP